MNAPSTVARLACDESTARRVAAYLGESLDGGAAACAAFEDDDGRWQVAVHFREPPVEAILRTLVKSAAGDAAADALTFETLEPADWVARSLAGLTPVRAGRIVVHGAHDRTIVRANDTGIEIEAALAFGTGHHGTTRGCLVALDMLRKRLRPRRVLDIGTGSGILAIAAAKMLRTHVAASDIDVKAINVARLNAHLNRTGPLIAFTCAAGAGARTIRAKAPYDLIFANILLSPLMRMAAPLCGLTAPEAHIVLSGLLPSHANAALSIYRAHGLMIERRILLDGWVTLLLRRK
jgi:ribosomal protein L11 methyltransferase